MKKLTKLALASSIAFSANAMALEALDDATMSATTGQDGLTIGIGISKIEIEKLFIHDNDGYDGIGGTGAAGAIYIQANGTGATANHGVVIGANYDDNGAYLLTTRNLADLKIDSDAGGGNPFINIAAAVSGLDIHIGEIGVVASGPQGGSSTSIRRGGEGDGNAILTGLSLKTGQLYANVQLGAAPQGAMIKLNATMLGGLTIENLGILDNSTASATREAGQIFIDKIQLTDSNSRDLTLNQSISIFGEEGNDTGFIRIVSTSGAHDNYVTGIHLGSKNAPSIGDMEVQGLQTYFSPALGQYVPGAIITVRGH